jgi:hypothetical protein
MLLIMWPFGKAQVVEVEPPPVQSPELQLAELNRLCHEAEGRFNSDVAALRRYNATNEQEPLVFKSGDTLRIQTFTNDLERLRLEKSVRESLSRRNRAWSARADLLLKLGVIQ